LYDPQGLNLIVTWPTSAPDFSVMTGIQGSADGAMSGFQSGHRAGVHGVFDLWLDRPLAMERSQSGRRL